MAEHIACSHCGNNLDLEERDDPRRRRLRLTRFADECWAGQYEFACCWNAESMSTATEASTGR